MKHFISITRSLGRQSSRLRNAYLVVIPVEHGVELAHENVTQHPERAFRGLHIQRHEAHFADGHVVVDDHVVGRVQVEFTISDVEGDHRQRGQVGAVVVYA